MARKDDTREMRLVSRLLEARLGEGVTLACFLAAKRHPGIGWLSWEGIGYELREVTGESFTREAIKRWATYLGVPLDTQLRDTGVLVTKYRRGLKKAGIPFGTDLVEPPEPTE